MLNSKYYQNSHKHYDYDTANQAYGLKGSTPRFFALSFAHRYELNFVKRKMERIQFESECRWIATRPWEAAK